MATYYSDFNKTGRYPSDTYTRITQVSSSVPGGVSSSIFIAGDGWSVEGLNITSSFSDTSSYSLLADTASFAVSASYEIVYETSSSYADLAKTSSYVYYDGYSYYVPSNPSLNGGIFTPENFVIGIDSNNDQTDRKFVINKHVSTVNLGSDASPPLLVVSENGNVGIGMFTPSCSLHVSGNICPSGSKIFDLGAPNTGTFNNAYINWVYGTASYAENALTSSYAVTLTVRDGASIGGVSEGVTSTDTVQIGAGTAPPTTNKKTDGAVQIGWGAGNNSDTASNAVQIGKQAGVNSTIANNAVQVGALAGANTSTASSAVQIGVSAGQNAVDVTSAVQIGNTAGAGSTTATNAVQVGSFAGHYSANATNATQVGASAGNQAKTGSYTTFIGSSADTLDATLNVEKSIAIGYNAKVSASNTCVIGGTGADAVSVAIGKTSAAATLDVNGNISASSVTASLRGTSSHSTYAETAGSAPSPTSSSYATTSSYALTGLSTSATSASHALNSDSTISASYASSSLSSSYSITSSYSWAGLSSSYAPSPVLVNSSSYTTGSVDTNAVRLVGNYYSMYTNTGSYNLTDGDNGRWVIFTTGSTVVATGSLSYGFTCTFMQSGSTGPTNTLLISGSSPGATIRNRQAHSASAGQYAVLSLLRVGATDDFV